MRICLLSEIFKIFRHFVCRFQTQKHWKFQAARPGLLLQVNSMSLTRSIPGPPAEKNNGMVLSHWRSHCFLQPSSGSTNAEVHLSTTLFSPAEIDQLDWSLARATFDPPVTAGNPGPNLLLRPLMLSDYSKGYINLLRQLTEVGHVEQTTFNDRFRAMQRCPGTYYVIVVEDTTRNTVVGAGSLVVEQKFIHSAGQRGRVEDIVVDGSCRGKQLGKLVVQTLVLLAEQLGCYKVSLECKDRLLPFYATFGFEKDQNFLVLRFDQQERGDGTGLRSGMGPPRILSAL